MISVIQLRRRKSNNNSNIILEEGEPYYNLAEKKLYVGNWEAGEAVDGKDRVDGKNKKHLTEIEKLSKDDVVKFQIGECKDNVFEQQVNKVASSHTIIWKKVSDLLSST